LFLVSCLFLNVRMRPHRKSHPRCLEMERILDFRCACPSQNLTNTMTSPLFLAHRSSRPHQSLSQSDGGQISGLVLDTESWDCESWPMDTACCILDSASSPGMLLDSLVHSGVFGASSGPQVPVIPESTCLDARQVWWRSNQAAAMPLFDSSLDLVSSCILIK
jgi:hypothetical protein